MPNQQQMIHDTLPMSKLGCVYVFFSNCYLEWMNWNRKKSEATVISGQVKGTLFQSKRGFGCFRCKPFNEIRDLWPPLWNSQFPFSSLFDMVYTGMLQTKCPMSKLVRGNDHPFSVVMHRALWRALAWPNSCKWCLQRGSSRVCGGIGSCQRDLFLELPLLGRSMCTKRSIRMVCSTSEFYWVLFSYSGKIRRRHCISLGYGIEKSFSWAPNAERDTSPTSIKNISYSRRHCDLAR